MTDLVLPDLTFPKMPYGTHQIRWDLRLLLYAEGTQVRRDLAMKLLVNGNLGQICLERLPLTIKIHQVLTTKLERGIAPGTFLRLLEVLWNFLKWAEREGHIVNFEKISSAYVQWSEWLLHQVRILNALTEVTAYSKAMTVADILGRALDYPHHDPGRTMMRMTRIRAPRNKKHVLGSQADKQNLAETFAFGHFLSDICAVLDLDGVRGPLPFSRTLSCGRNLFISGGLKNLTINLDALRYERDILDATKSRAPLADGVSILNDFRRSRFLNLRIEAELLIFVAQTGMNLASAEKLQRDHYRWQTDGEDIQAFRTYKGRRHGDAIFRCFKAYREHLERYLAWLTATGLADADVRMFPFPSAGKIPASYRSHSFQAIRDVSKEAGIKYFLARKLRKTRINWLLRRSRDPELTSEMAAHSRETLLRVYDQPHHQLAAIEILRFHQLTDPTLTPPGPGICADPGRTPMKMENHAAEAPQPDCVSPEGCLFCVHHRDVMSADYCWKLASHARIKSIELSLYRPSKNDLVHPGQRVLDRILAKLGAIAEASAVRGQWVRDAQDAVRSNRYHPEWDGHIVLLELFA